MRLNRFQDLSRPLLHQKGFDEYKVVHGISYRIYSFLFLKNNAVIIDAFQKYMFV